MGTKKEKMKRIERIRFRIANWLNNSSKHCWADLAMFGMGHNMWHNLTNRCGDACRKESETHDTGRCYCGKFMYGRAWDELSPSEQNLFKADIDESLPF